MKKIRIFLISMFITLTLTSCNGDIFSIDNDLGEEGRITKNKTFDVGDKDTKDNKDSKNEDGDKYIEETLNIINKKRQERDLSILETNDNLNGAANLRAREISGPDSFSSIRPDGRDWITVTEQFKIKYTQAAENIASGYKTPEELINNLSKKTGANEAIFNEEFNKVGIGLYRKTGIIYWELLFVNDETFKPIPKEEYAKEVLKLTNQERTKAGLSILHTNSPLRSAADQRSVEIVSLFEHIRPNGKSIYSVLDEHLIRYKTAGENIAYGQATPEDVVDGWMNSPGHRENILNNTFNKMGVGVYQHDGVIYWTQLFTD